MDFIKVCETSWHKTPAIHYVRGTYVHLEKKKKPRVSAVAMLSINARLQMPLPMLLSIAKKVFALYRAST